MWDNVGTKIYYTANVNFSLVKLFIILSHLICILFVYMRFDTKYPLVWACRVPLNFKSAFAQQFPDWCWEFASGSFSASHSWLKEPSRRVFVLRHKGVHCVVRNNKAPPSLSQLILIHCAEVLLETRLSETKLKRRGSLITARDKKRYGPVQKSQPHERCWESARLRQ